MVRGQLLTSASRRGGQGAREEREDGEVGRKGRETPVREGRREEARRVREKSKGYPKTAKERKTEVNVDKMKL